MKISSTKSVSLITLLCFILYSCGGTFRKSEAFNIKKMYDDINSYAEGHKVQIIMTNNDFYSGHNFHMDEESASLIDMQKQKIDIKTSDIHQIIIKNKISSITIGVIVGSLITYSLSLLSGIPVRGRPGSGVGLGIGILISAAIGGFIGALQNTDKVFIINE